MIQPLAGFVFIEAETRFETEQAAVDARIPGLLLATPKFQGPPSFGHVRAVGAGVTVVKVGDKVHFTHPGKKGFEFEGQRLLKVEAKDINAIVEPD